MASDAGSTGAGKATYAQVLAERLGGVCLSGDEWMNTLCWPDLPEKSDFTWAMERVQRCEVQASKLAVQLAVRGVPAVIDSGLTTRTQREGWAAWGGGCWDRWGTALIGVAERGALGSGAGS